MMADGVAGGQSGPFGSHLGHGQALRRTRIPCWRKPANVRPLRPPDGGPRRSTASRARCIGPTLRRGGIDAAAAAFASGVGRRPVQRVVGWTEFRGLRMGCAGEVLIPARRQRKWWGVPRDHGPDAGRPVAGGCSTGTGSGCMALAIQSERPDWRWWPWTSPKPHQARANAAQLGLEKVEWRLGMRWPWTLGLQDLGRHRVQPALHPGVGAAGAHVHDHEPGMACMSR